MNDRKVFKQVDGEWVYVGKYAASEAYLVREQLRAKGFKVRTQEATDYEMGLRSIFK